MINCIKSKNRGFTFVEILAVLAIITSLTTVVILSFNSLGGRQSLDKTSISVISILNEARSMAMSSKDFSNYGVRISTGSIISFKNNYGNENRVFELPNLVNISDINISSDIIFNKLSGDTNATGTFSVFLKKNPLKKVVIRISNTGLVEKI